MTSHAAIPDLDRSGLRKFGLTTGAMIAGLFGVALPLLLGHGWPRWPWIALALLAFVAIGAPGALGPVYRTWMRFGLIAGRVTTPLLLGIVFALVIVPAGLIIRLTGRDAMARRRDENAATYRVPSRRRQPQSLERPF